MRCGECGEERAVVASCVNEDCCACVGERLAWHTDGFRAGQLHTVKLLTSALDGTAGTLRADPIVWELFERLKALGPK